MKSLHSFYEVALVCVRKGGKLSAEKSQKCILTLQKGLICSPEFAIEFKIGIHIRYKSYSSSGIRCQCIHVKPKQQKL